MNDCRASFSTLPNVSPLHNMLVSITDWVEEEIALGPSVSILGCKHIVVVSPGNVVFHNGGVSTTGCYLGEILWWWGVLVGGGRTEWSTAPIEWLWRTTAHFEVHPSTVAYLQTGASEGLPEGPAGTRACGTHLSVTPLRGSPCPEHPRQAPNGNGVLHGFCESRSRIRKIIQAFFFLNFKRRVNELRLIYILKRPLVMYACGYTKLCMTPAERLVCVLQNYKASWKWVYVQQRNRQMKTLKRAVYTRLNFR